MVNKNVNIFFSFFYWNARVCNRVWTSKIMDRVNWVDKAPQTTDWIEEWSRLDYYEKILFQTNPASGDFGHGLTSHNHF